MSKIFVVDDDSQVRSFCYDLFTEEGHEVATFPSGEKLLALLSQDRPDLVLLDFQLTEESGLSILKKIPQTKGKIIPVVIFSGSINAEFEKRCYEAGAVEVIHKGLDAKDLSFKINKIIAAKHRLLGEPDASPKGKILIVDDEESIRNLLSEFFQGKGYKILLAKNGEEAVALVKRERPSVILLDIVMPGMDGILTLKKIREIDSQVGVVVATSVSDEEVAREAVALGAYAYVLKPFDLTYIGMVVMTRVTIAA